MSKLKNEPAVITSVLVALVGAAATLGIIGTDTQDQLVAVITAVVPIIGGLIVRANVTPTRKIAPIGTVTVKLKPQFVDPEPPADAPVDDATIASDATPDPTPAPEPTPEPTPAPAEDPVKAQLKDAIEQVRANSNQINDQRAAAAKAAVDASA